MMKGIQLFIGLLVDLEKQIDWTELTCQQLSEWGAKYHELRVDKPFYDLFIEDKALRIEEL